MLLVGQALLKDPPAFHHDGNSDGDGDGHGHWSDCLDQVSSKF